MGLFSKKKNGPTSTIWISMVMRRMLPAFMNNFRVPRREQKSNSNTPCSVDLLLSHTAFIETKLVRTYTMMYALAERSMRGKRSEKLGRTGRNTAEFVRRVVRTDSAVLR